MAAYLQQAPEGTAKSAAFIGSNCCLGRFPRFLIGCFSFPARYSPRNSAAFLVALFSLLPDTRHLQCFDVIKFLEFKVGQLDAHELQRKLSLVDVNESLEATQGAINCLIYLFRGALLNKLAVEDLVAAIKTTSLFGASVVPVVKHVWSEQGASLIANQHSRIFSVGQLAKLDWKLAVATQSDSCQTLASPYVAAVFHVSQPDGTLVAYPVELSLAEFHVRRLCIVRIILTHVFRMSPSSSRQLRPIWKRSEKRTREK